MPSSYSARARWTLQATGEGNSVWGTILNNGAFKLIEDAVVGVLALTVSGTVTLTSANGATDQARMSALQVTGTGGTIIVPAVQYRYVIDATAATGPISVSTGSGTSATVPKGLTAMVYSPDGVNYRIVSDPSARAYTDAVAASLSAGNLPGGSMDKSVLYTATAGATATWKVLTLSDLSDGPQALSDAADFAFALAAAL